MKLAILGIAVYLVVTIPALLLIGRIMRAGSEHLDRPEPL